MNKKLILFDLDGTLLDTAPDFIQCVNQLRERHGMEPLASATIRAQVSNGARALTQLAFNLSADSEHLEPLRQELLALYLEILGNHTTLFSGMAECLQWIESNALTWGIVTNKPSAYTFPLLARLALPFTPATVICPDHVSKTKPHPEPLWLACSQGHCSAEEAVYLGDHSRDIEAGQAAGMTTISCGWGYIATDDDCLLWHADHHLLNPKDIAPLIERLNRQ